MRGRKNNRRKIKKTQGKPTYTKRVRLQVPAPQVDDRRSRYEPFPFKQVTTATEGPAANWRGQWLWKMYDGYDGNNNRKYIFGRVVRPNRAERNLDYTHVFITPVLDWRGLPTGYTTRRLLKGSEDLLKRRHGLELAGRA